MSIEFLIDDNLKAKKNANKKLRKVVREVTKKPKEADYNASNVIFLRKFVLAMRYAGKEMQRKKNAEFKLRQLVSQQQDNMNKLNQIKEASFMERKELPQVDRKDSEDYIEKVPVPLRFNINNAIKPRLNDNLQADNIVLEHNKPFKLQINRDVLNSALSSMREDKDFLHITAPKRIKI